SLPCTAWTISGQSLYALSCCVTACLRLACDARWTGSDAVTSGLSGVTSQNGDPLEGGRTMLATIARFCVRNRRWVLLAWVLLFVVGIVVGSQVFNRLKDTNGGLGAESVQGSTILDKASSMGPSAVVLVKGPAVAAASTRTAVQTLTARLERLPQVTGAVNAYTSPDPRLRASDGHAGLIVVSV